MRKVAMMLTLILFSSLLQAEPFQDGFRYGTYGVVAGALAGGTIMALSDDPGSRLTPVARGASMGLYAGLLVALYKNYTDSQDFNYHVQPAVFGSIDKPTYGLAYQAKF